MAAECAGLQGFSVPGPQEEEGPAGAGQEAGSPRVGAGTRRRTHALVLATPATGASAGPSQSVWAEVCGEGRSGRQEPEDEPRAGLRAPTTLLLLNSEEETPLGKMIVEPRLGQLLCAAHAWRLSRSPRRVLLREGQGR